MPTPTPVPRSKSACSCRKFSCSLEAYAGIGGGVAVTIDGSTIEIISRIGIGLGGGISFDPNQRISPHSKNKGSGYILRSAAAAQGDLSLGSLGIGVAAATRTGNAITTKVGGEL